ncbi:MAG TPA: phage tail terminator-like protein [Rhodocyclaceae bacterium]|nr:phage tail terminator-like protein [Rhodocyclaceae bacterium]
MSQASIRNALENALAAVAPAIDLVHENQEYAPIADRPFLEVFIRFATPNNPTMGAGFYQELGFMQVNVMFPLKAGTAEAAAQAQVIRDAFKRGKSFTDSGITVQIDKTPEISGGTVDGDHWKTVLRAPFHADIFT